MFKDTECGYDPAHIEKLKKEYMNAAELNSENLELRKQLVELENEDKRADTQRRMVWFALFGMLLYPLFIMIADYMNLDTASNLMSTIAPTYFISASLIVMVFFGAEGVIKILADKMDVHVIKKRHDFHERPMPPEPEPYEEPDEPEGRYR